MKRAASVHTLASLLSVAGLLVAGCSAEVQSSSTDDEGAETARLRSCGNGRCDHGETCSTCPRDCGACPGADLSMPPPDMSMPPSNPCGSTASPPAHYQHVIIFSFENRTWSNVGLGFSASTMPYLHSLASQCSYFSDWTETNTAQNSLTQYIGETSGVSNANTVNDCSPSSTSCRSTDDNIFRQVRRAGGTARSYVEGATTSCSASGNAAKHIPALYYYGTYTEGTSTRNDHEFCDTEVRPYGEFDVNNLPTYAFITPTLCNDGHDCGDSVVDAWARTNIQKVLDSAAYKAGTVAVFIWYDEDHPVPNLHIAPTSHKGDITQTGVGTHAALLKTIEDMLGLPFMSQGQLPGATDLRSLLGI
jgi:phosphatidylinositol-3-phosphatase